MHILINGRLAALKKGTSFQFIFENRQFTGSDSYTLNISFPLAGCPENLAIFGNIARKDVKKEPISYPCEISDGNFHHFGTITITSITPEEVKTQFLEGRSEQNFADDFDEVFINELNLGTPYSTLTSQSPSEVWDTCDTGRTYVALPWVNNTSGNIQNKAVYNSSTDSFSWDPDTRGLSFQPYLTYILHRLANALGYSIDIDAIADSYFGYLLICNTLPFSWGMPEFAKALPHWTVTEFLEQLELLLGGEFEIDHRAKSISFAFTKDILNGIPPVKLDNIVDSYTTEVSSTDDQCEYQGAANLSYTPCSHSRWKYYDCPWLIDTFRHFTYTQGRTNNKVVTEDRVIEYASYRDLLTDAKNNKTVSSFSGRTSSSIVDRILYARDIDTYFAFITLSYEMVSDGRGSKSPRYHLALIPINSFGQRILKEDNPNAVELKIVPAWVDYTDDVNGDILFLECGELDNTTEAEMITDDRVGRYYLQPQPIRVCQAGDKEKSEEFFDKIYFGFWDSSNNAATPSFLPRPALDKVSMRADFTCDVVSLRNLRLNDTQSASAPHPIQHTINTLQKFNFSFLSDEIPDVRAVFHIHGRRYLCEKITASFDEMGRSQLLKGVFYEILSAQNSSVSSVDPPSVDEGDTD